MSTQTVPNDIINILADGSIEGNVFKLTCGQLDRKTYDAVNKVLASLGGKWNRKCGGHVFKDDPNEVVEQMLITGTYTNKKQEFQFFETPPGLTAYLVHLAAIDDNSIVLEPSAGRGAIARAAREKAPKVDIFCIDIQEENVIRLRELGFNAIQADFLACEPNPIYTNIVMNPPFTKQQDIDHVLHAWKFLVPYGRLVSIMSASVEFRTNKKSILFRELVSAQGNIESIKDGAFKISGTNVKTIIVTLEKF